MSIDEKIIAIIAAYAYTTKITIKRKRAHHTTIVEVKNTTINLWRLSSKLEVMMGRIL